MFLVRWIFKHSGAFFVNQTFEDDPLYKAVFSEYVVRLMLDGFPLEIFVEGTR
jgi:glycerol-3-phosphate O-acyltransferase